MKITKTTRKDRGTGAVTPAWKLDWFDDLGKRHRQKFATRKEAEEFKFRIESKIRNGTLRSNAYTTTVRSLSDIYLAHCEKRHRRGERMTTATLYGYKAHIRNYILAEGVIVKFNSGIGDVTLEKLTPKRIGDFRDAMRDFEVSVPMTRAVLRTLHAMLAYAKSQDIVGSNACTGVKVIGRRDEGSKKVTAPSHAAISAALRLASGQFALMLRVAAALGCRTGELRALRWRHFDFAGKTVTIETRVDAWYDEDGQGSKSSASIRQNPIGAAVIAELQRWRATSPLWGDDELVFFGRRLSYVSASYFSQKLQKTLDEIDALHLLGDPRFPNPAERFTPHTLRHFAISTWIAAGMNPKEVQTFAGHSTVAVTMDIYGHMFPKESHGAAMDELSKWLLQ